jgi:heme exporter protein D
MNVLGIDLGKYAGFILPAYGLTAAFFVWIIAASLISARRWRREAEHLQAERDSADR